MSPACTDAVAEGRLTRLALYVGYAGLVSAYYLMAKAAGLTPRNQVMSTWSGTFVLTCVLGAGYVVAVTLWTLFEMPSTYAELGTRLKQRLLGMDSLERILGIFVLGAGVNVMFDVFAAFKPAIPSFRPYTWDPLLAELDRVLHLGRDPWRWLHVLPARDQFTRMMDWIYVRWYDVMVVVLCLVLTAAPLGARVRFFLGFILMWALGGTLLGTALASGGPVYFAGLTGDAARFAPLLSYLDGAAPLARGLQHTLWEAFVRPDAGFPFEGISAMPSLHVAVAVYMALWAWRVHRWFGLVAVVYAVMILLGSVHLGWHYAIDGYAGAAIAGVCWWASERVTLRRAKA